MTPVLLAGLIGLALLDSLNPFLFVALLFLLTTPAPLVRSIAYILGILVLNYTAGVLLFTGVRTLILEWLNNIDDLLFVLAQIALGTALIVYGVLAKPANDDTLEEARKPISLSPLHCFLLGMAVMLNEVTTALPYFAAVERLVAARVTFTEMLLGLMVYNAVFILPLIGFVVAAMLLRDRFDIDRVSQRVQHLTRVLLKWGSLIFGILLVVDAVLNTA